MKKNAGLILIVISMSMIMSCTITLASAYADAGILAEETEPNNAFTEADSLPYEGFAKGSLSSVQDADWWTFTVSEKGLYQIDLIPDNWVEEGADHDGWRVSLMDAGRREIAKGKLMKLLIRLDKKALGPGRYYVRVMHEAYAESGPKGYKILLSDVTTATEGSSGARAKNSYPNIKTTAKKKAVAAKKQSGIKKTLNWFNR